METAQLALALLIAVAGLVTIARWVGIAYPIFLVIGGLLLGLVPGTPRVEIDPDLIFLFVCPRCSTSRPSSRRWVTCARTWARSARWPSASSSPARSPPPRWRTP